MRSLLLTIWLGAGVASGQPAYDVVELTPLPGTYPIAAMHDVAADGRSVGRNWTLEGGTVRNHHAVLWSASGEPMDLGDDGVWSEAWGIAENGIVAGRHDVGSQMLGALWIDGTREVLPPLAGDLSSQAFDVDAAGVAVGASYFDGGTTAVRWVDGVPRTLAGANDQSWAFAVNDAGAAVGRRDTQQREAMLWIDDDYTILPDLGQGFASATNISANGTISGGALDENQHLVPILWAAGSHEISRLPEPSFGFGTTVWDVNDDGVAVGDVCIGFDCDVWERRAIVWVRNHAYDLNDLVPADSGWVLFTAAAISEAGEIVGSGAFPESGPSIRAFKLTPAGLTAADEPDANTASLLVSPNPLCATAEVSFANTIAGPAELRVHDLAGRRVATRHFAQLAPGTHRVNWGDLVGPTPLPSGIYLLHLERPGRPRAATRVIVLR